MAWVVNARHLKAVPVRKTDLVHVQWLACLARAGLLCLVHGLSGPAKPASHCPPETKAWRHAGESMFGSAQRLAAWVGMCPGNNESAVKRTSGRLRKGNARVRRLLYEFEQTAGRSRCALKEVFQAPNVRKGHKRSLEALGHKMPRTIDAMLSQHTHSVDKTADDAALMVARHVARWRQMLVQHGFVPAPV